jgi:uncharacterized protein (TIGR00730 family)
MTLTGKAARRVAVYCGSANGNNPAFLAEAQALGAAIAAAGLGLVYGGASAGLMGAVAEAALAGGAEVIGVLPDILAGKEIAHNGLTSLELVSTMHERKARMAELADAFVALPGGAGTLDELFEAWTWGQLGLHSKPVALFDGDHFYRPLFEQLEVMAGAGYLDQAYLASVGRVSSAEDFLRFVADYRPRPPKWPAPVPEVERGPKDWP